MFNHDGDSRPSLNSQDSRGQQQNNRSSSESRDEFDSSVEEADEDYEDEATPDVQKVHFNQTVQALFTIRATGLTMPPFEQI